MAVKQRLDTYYEGESTDEKPAGVIPRSVFREIDTNKMWITYDGDNWIVVDKRVRDTFGGNVYSKTMTMGDGDPTRFETIPKKLRDCLIIVETHPMLWGKTGVVVYPVGVGDRIGFTKIDISTLYFQNASADNDAKITVLGVEE